MSNEKKIAIILFGRPGSGKGTQAKLLAERLNLYQFMTSKEGKDYISTHTDPDTQRQKELYASGKLWEPEWIAKIVLERTREIFNQVRGIVYDGSPRTLYEAEVEYPFFVDLFGREHVKVFLIDISEEEHKLRAARRLVCSVNTHHVYIRSDEFQPGIACPEGDGALDVRDLDHPEVIQVRTHEYENRTMPGVEFVKEKHPIKVINGEQSVEKVYEDIIKAL